MMTEQRVPLFSNSTEYDDWVKNNCQKCTKHRPEAVTDDSFLCDIDEAIQLDAPFNDGCVDSAIAQRMGWKGRNSPCGEKHQIGTAYRLPLDKIKFIADLPSTQPDSEIFTPEVMAKDLELLAGQSPEFVLGFASAVDCVMGSFNKFMELSYTADVPVIMFEKIMLTMAVTACQKYLKDKEP